MEQSDFVTTLRQHEQRRIDYASLLNQEAMVDTSSPHSLVDSPWTERTAWKNSYHGVRRDILIAMTQLPDRYSQACGFSLGIFQGRELHSLVDDELCIQMILKALGRAFDRCEETVDRTGQPILCWLRSRHRNQAY